MLSVHLLVVDDRPDSLNVTCCALRAAGLEVTGYTSPSHALAAASWQRFDLLLSVVELPQMSGADLLQAARAADPHLVGILVTGQGSREVEEQAAGAGASELLRRPLRVQEMFGAVERALGLPRASLAVQPAA